MPRMNTGTRASIAYVVGMLLHPGAGLSIYDLARGRHIHFNGEVSPDRIWLYNHETASHLSGKATDEGLSLYDLGVKCHLDLTISGNDFGGYDHGTCSHFRGTVAGAAISLYDYQHSVRFHYRM